MSAELLCVVIEVGVVRAGQVTRVEGDSTPLNAASLAKQVVGHLALTVCDDLEESVHGAITVRHVLSHTTGLANWSPPDDPARAIRTPGTRFGYSGEGFALLQRHLEHSTGHTLDELAAQHVFAPFGMLDSYFGAPEMEFHGNRPLFTTAGDYARFLAHVLGLDDERWHPQCSIDGELAWGAGWGLELGPPVWGWQWGHNTWPRAASNLVIGCPTSGDGVVVLTDLADGREHYRTVVERELPGDHPSLRVERNPAWLALFE
ncbi:MAG TPA: serine hydrolase domain-containing protein [Acidimicrobiia bacterium]